MKNRITILLFLCISTALSALSIEVVENTQFDNLPSNQITIAAASEAELKYTFEILAHRNLFSWSYKEADTFLNTYVFPNLYKKKDFDDLTFSEFEIDNTPGNRLYMNYASVYELVKIFKKSVNLKGARYLLIYADLNPALYDTPAGCYIKYGTRAYKAERTVYRESGWNGEFTDIRYKYRMPDSSGIMRDYIYSVSEDRTHQYYFFIYDLKTKKMFACLEGGGNRIDPYFKYTGWLHRWNSDWTGTAK